LLINIVSAKYPNARVDGSTDFFEVGLTDSLALLEIVLTVENETTMSFNPESLDFEGPITPLKMASAFQSQNVA
jgi:acyl carrier protein